jgi:hypothetical protein
MIHGLKLGFTGEEIVRAIDARIANVAATIQRKRDEIDGKVEPEGRFKWQEPAEVVEQEIRVLQIRLDTLTMYRGRIVPAETYLLGRRALKWANLMPPEPPPVVYDDEESKIRWVTRAT